MPPIERTRRVAIADFSKGLRQISNPLALPAGFATDMNNVDVHNTPVLSTRRGVAAFDVDPANEAAGLFQFRTQGGLYMLLKALGSTGDILRYDGVTPWVSIGNMTPTLPVYGVSMPSKDWIIFGDGLLMKKYDGTTFADLGGAPPKLRHLEVHLSKLWGTEGYNTIRYSVTGNPEDWTTVDDAGEEVLDNPEGDPITAMKSHRDALFVWTRGAMYVVLGDDPFNFTIKPIADADGCYSHFSVAEVDGFLYWFGPEGISRYYYGAKAQVISRDWIDSIIADSDVNEHSKVSAGTDGVRYYLSLPGVTIDREIVFDPRYRAFLPREGQSYHRYLHWRMP